MLSKRISKANVGLLLNRAVFLVTKDFEKVEVINAFLFSHFFACKDCSHVPKPIDRVYGVNCERQN